MNAKGRTRLAISLIMALIFGGATYFAVLAQPSKQPALQTGDKCYTCHQALYGAWHSGAHGQAFDDPIFQDRWEEQDYSGECLFCHTTGYNPGTGTWNADGISCSGCHAPVPEDHPQSPAPINRSSTLCETCHNESVYEWKTSQHRLSGMTCIDCHSQHTATLRAADVGLLCVSCHHDIPPTYTHKIHTENDISCPDCHMENLTGAAVKERGYTATDHNFNPKITACDNCHEYRLDEVGSESTATVSLGVDYHDMLTEYEVLGISVEPNPVNPMSFVIVSSLVGMVAGLLLSPWIQEKYQRFDFLIQPKDNGEEE